MRQLIDGSGPEETIFDGDLEKEKHGSEYFGLGSVDVSYNDKLLSYSLDLVGSEYYSIYIRDIATGKIFNDKNPYDTNNFAVKRGGTWVLGQVTLLANPTTLSLYTCFKEPCNLNANRFRLDISIP